MGANRIFGVTGMSGIVTGGAAGIGFAIARRLAEAGAHVLLADLDESAASRAASRMTGAVRVKAMGVDVAADGAGDRMADACVREFGGLDFIVNNAGIYPMKPMMQMAPELFDTVYRVNLRGLAFAAKAAAARMIAAGKGGRIVNIASIDSVHPSMVGLAAYDASKGGVLMFTKSLALELAPHRILVNAIAPGGIATEGTARPLQGSGMSPAQMKAMLDQFAKAIPLGRMGEPDDIAKVAQFLLSDAAGYMTGSLVVVDGGSLIG